MKKKVFLIAMLVFITVANSFAQTCDCSANPSGALISTSLYFKRAALFPASKVFTAVNAGCAGTQPLNAGTFNLDAFFGLLDSYNAADVSGLKIYFGRLSQTTDITANRYAEDYENILVPIFVATKKDNVSAQHDVGNYYIFDPHTGSLVIVSQDAAQSWYRNYLGCPNLPANPTKKLVYERKLLTDWRNDICCQRKTNRKIKEITIAWGIYDTDIEYPVGSGSTLSTTGSLTMMFNVPYALAKVAETADYKKNLQVLLRKALLTNKAATLQSVDGDGTYDTAAPCPPAPNCDDPGDGLKP